MNSPHNPTGKVFSVEDLSFIANLCQKWNVYAILDEVSRLCISSCRRLTMLSAACLAYLAANFSWVMCMGEVLPVMHASRAHSGWPGAVECKGLLANIWRFPYAGVRAPGVQGQPARLHAEPARHARALHPHRLRRQDLLPHCLEGALLPASPRLELSMHKSSVGQRACLSAQYCSG